MTRSTGVGRGGKRPNAGPKRTPYLYETQLFAARLGPLAASVRKFTVRAEWVRPATAVVEDAVAPGGVEGGPNSDHSAATECSLRAPMIARPKNSKALSCMIFEWHTF